MSDGEINVDSIDGEVSTSANIVGQLYPQGEKGDTGEPGQDGFSPIVTTEKVGKTTTITITEAEGVHTATILDGADGQGTGDMRTEVYDTDQNGIVDNAEKVNNHTVNSDVPADAVFTDTTYTAGTGIDITGNVITNTQTSAEWGNITGTLSDQTDLKNALDSKANTSTVPTKVSDLNNDSGFIDKDVNNLTNYDTSTTVDTKISNSEEVLIGSDSGIKASHELWVDPNDVTPYVNSEISNSYGTAQNLGYSQEYVNDRFDGTKPMGDVVVDSIKTKNLFSDTIASHNVVISDTGAETANGQWDTSDYIALTIGKKYTLSFTATGQDPIRLSNYNADKEFQLRSVIGGTTTLTINANNCIIRISYNRTTCSNIQLEEGETATTYAEHQHLDFKPSQAGELVVDNIRSKNMLNIDACSWGTISTTDGKTISGSSSIKHTVYIPVKPSTQYTLSYNGSQNLYVRGFRYGSTKNYIDTIIISGSSSNVAYFTTANNQYFLRIQFDNTNFSNEFQLEEGHEQTYYRPYQELNNQEVYSSDEKIIGTWINGKPIYRKVIYFGELPNATTKTVAHGIINLDRVVNFYGFGQDSYKNVLPITMTDVSTISKQSRCYLTSTDILIQNGLDRSSLDAYIIIEYTKTTD